MLLLACAAPEAEPTFTPPAPPEDGVQVHVPALTLLPGEEVERCLFLSAGNADDAWIGAIEMVARDGLHHAMLVRSPEVRSDEVACFGIPEELMEDYRNVPEPIFASSTQVTEERVELPEGVGISLPAEAPLLVNYHAINTTDAPLDAEVWFNLYATEATEQAELYVMGNLLGIEVPPHGSQTLSTTCTFPYAANVLSLTPHMHAHGRSFLASLVTANGERSLLETTSWENPATEWFAPPVAVEAGDALRFTCTWDNAGDEPVLFGPTADDEMCFVFGYHWPAKGLLWRADYDEEACTVGG